MFPVSSLVWTIHAHTPFPHPTQQKIMKSRPDHVTQAPTENRTTARAGAKKRSAANATCPTCGSSSSQFKPAPGILDAFSSKFDICDCGWTIRSRRTSSFLKARNGLMCYLHDGATGARKWVRLPVKTVNTLGRETLDFYPEGRVMAATDIIQNVHAADLIYKKHYRCPQRFTFVAVTSIVVLLIFLYAFY